MTSEAAAQEAYVWIWLPGQTDPVVAGVLTRSADRFFVFNYGQSYLRRNDAVAIYLPELPLETGVIPLLPGLSMPNAIRDGSPDAWGRRVIINQITGHKGAEAARIELDELTYLLRSGSDRAGALDFQSSPTAYAARQGKNAQLNELIQAAARIDEGKSLPPELEQALQHGSSLGGARPKALVESGDRKFIAKFSASRDVYNVVKGEFIAMRLAALAGINTAYVHLELSLGKDVLLIERFDRVKTDAGWTRKAMVSALTMLELDELMGRYASYEDLAEIIRHRFVQSDVALRELFARMVFNLLCGNTDDHARNHAAFWNGRELMLTPAYDICPQSRTGLEASQAMLISGPKNASHLFICMEAAPAFLLLPQAAKDIIEQQIESIEKHWKEVCDEAELGVAERDYFWGRQFLNPFVFEGYER